MTTVSVGYLAVLPGFDYLAPTSVKEACSMLEQHRGEVKVMAGGTDLLVSMKKREIRPKYVLSINKIPNMAYIAYTPENGMKIGARTALQVVADDPVVREKFGMLAAGCNKVGTPQVRNMGSIGGNICNGGPSQDSIPALLVLDARLKLVGLDGERIVPIETFFVSPFKTILADTEILTEIQIPPLKPETSGCYRWVTKISEEDETLSGVAVLLTLEPSSKICKEVKIGLTSIAPTPIRARMSEELLCGKEINESLINEVADAVAQEIRPRSRADYRRRMTRWLVKEAFNEALASIR